MRAGAESLPGPPVTYSGNVFNIGVGEMLALAVIGLLVFGPERLPAAVRRGSALVRQLRAMAGEATAQIRDAAGLDDEDGSDPLQQVKDLHPRRLVSSGLEPSQPPRGSAPRQASGREGGSTPTATESAIDPDLI